MVLAQGASLHGLVALLALLAAGGALYQVPGWILAGRPSIRC